jgi:hypothetical protein
MPQPDPCRGASNLAGRSGSEPVKPRNLPPARNGLRGFRECRAGGQTAKAMSASNVWNISMSDSPGLERTACQEGMRSESPEPLAGRLGTPAQRKASRISRHAAKSRCACEWGGWGRLSDDGPGQNNPDPSEGPWGRWSTPPHGGASSSPQARRRADHRSDHEMHEGRMQTGGRTANAGSRLKPLTTQEGTV